MLTWDKQLTLQGWVRTFRANRFIAINDGSTLNNLQCVVDFEQTDENLLKRITTGAAVKIEGTLVESQGKGQQYEVQVSRIEILGRLRSRPIPHSTEKTQL